MFKFNLVLLFVIILAITIPTPASTPKRLRDGVALPNNNGGGNCYVYFTPDCKACHTGSGAYYLCDNTVRVIHHALKP